MAARLNRTAAVRRNFESTVRELIFSSCQRQPKGLSEFQRQTHGGHDVSSFIVLLVFYEINIAHVALGHTNRMLRGVLG